MGPITRWRGTHICFSVNVEKIIRNNKMDNIEELVPLHYITPKVTPLSSVEDSEII